MTQKDALTAELGGIAIRMRELDRLESRFEADVSAPAHISLQRRALVERTVALAREAVRALDGPTTAPAWVDYECPDCGEIYFARSDECHECETCGAMFYIPRFDEPQYIGPAWGEESA